MISAIGMRGVKMIWRLSRTDWIVLTEAVALAVPLELGLRWIRLKTLLRLIGRTRRPRWRTAPIDVERAARLVDVASRFYPFRPTCLKRSLVLLRILRARGLPAELRVGVRKVGDELHSHAWIECRGRILLDRHTADGYVMVPLEIH
jgi:transglutaminase superfamily protein